MDDAPRQAQVVDRIAVGADLVGRYPLALDQEVAGVRGHLLPGVGHPVAELEIPCAAPGECGPPAGRLPVVDDRGGLPFLPVHNATVSSCGIFSAAELALCKSVRIFSSGVSGVKREDVRVNDRRRGQVYDCRQASKNWCASIMKEMDSFSKSRLCEAKASTSCWSGSGLVCT